MPVFCYSFAPQLRAIRSLYWQAIALRTKSMRVPFRRVPPAREGFWFGYPNKSIALKRDGKKAKVDGAAPTVLAAFFPLPTQDRRSERWSVTFLQREVPLTHYPAASCIGSAKVLTAAEIASRAWSWFRYGTTLKRLGSPSAISDTYPSPS